jgi:hypothetical protein
MSFDIFVQKFRGAKPVSFQRSVFDEIFGQFIVDRQHHFLRLRYPDQGGGAEVYIHDGPELDSMMFNHCGGDMFFRDLYELMKRARAVVHWADLPPNCVIPDEAMMKELPQDFIKAVKTPSVVHNGREIVEAIGRSGEG